MKRLYMLLLALLCAQLSVAEPRLVASKPNIIVILADDLGYGDVGFNGCREIPTPNLDALARSGARFSSGYASHPYCSPSRAGLLTGRHQQRFGHEGNPAGAKGLPLTETLLPAVLKAHGYQTAAIGKWHLGGAPDFWPTQRGFDYWYGFRGGSMDYWGGDGKGIGIVRNGTPVPKSEQSYLTDDFSREAADFIGRNQDKPFFLYLAYNAPHSPDQVTKAHLKKTEHIEYGRRAVYGAMVAGMDEGIGKVLQKLDDLKLRDQTLVFFFSDNGGRVDGAVNFPFRGHKGMLFEGGIRVPFCVSWPTRIPGGKTFDAPITALDIFPTVLAAAGIPKPEELSLDGLNLLPHLTDGKNEMPARTLVWRYTTGRNEYGYAVRDGNYKLVSSVYKGKKLLFNLETDPFEQHDLTADHADIVQRLTDDYEQWAKGMMPPLWGDGHGKHVRSEEAARQAEVDSASEDEPKK